MNGLDEPPGRGDPGLGQSREKGSAGGDASSIKSLRRALSRPVWFIAAAAVALELVVAGRYGYHRDELYFLVSFHHLAVSYVDQLLLTPLTARFGNAVFGGSLIGFRLLPALSLGGLVAMTGLFAAELGAGRLGQVIAATSTALCAEFLAAGHLVSPTPFDQLAWAVLSYLVLRLVRTGDPRRWLMIGVVAGVALENKWNPVFLFLGLGVGFILTPERRLVRSWYLLGGAALAVALWTPSLVWQALHGWPNFAVFTALAHQAGHNRAVYLPAQIVYTGLVATVVWVARAVVAVPGPGVPALSAVRLGGRGGADACLDTGGQALLRRAGLHRAVRRGIDATRTFPQLRSPPGAAAGRLPLHPRFHRCGRGPCGPSRAACSHPRHRATPEHQLRPGRDNRLAPTGRTCRFGLPVPPACGTPYSRHPHRQLRRGRGHRSLRSVHGTAPRLQWQQQLLAVGSSTRAPWGHH